MQRIVEAFTTKRPMARMTKIPREELYVSKPTWWLESRFHFSFAEYRHPKKASFGSLFVLNDDIVKPRAGFGAHPHRNAEIFSYVVDGELSHQDSMGNKEALPRGSVQYLSAGSGIVHSEMNDGDVNCRFLQVWIQPDKKGVAPQYGSKKHGPEERHNRWLHLLGGTGTVPQWEGMSAASEIALHQDCNVMVSERDPAAANEISLGAARRMYLVCIEGSMTLNGDTELHARDAVEIMSSENETLLKFKAGENGMHILAIEMAL